VLLALDAGNTNITVGVFDGRKLVTQWRHLSASPDDLGRLLADQARRRSVSIDAAVYGSVVPKLDPVIERAVRSRFGVTAKAVTPKSRLGIALRVRRPGQVGADRLLNALAAHERSGGPAVVLDFGTATTFDCVADDGAYLGGAILLGPNLAAEALHRRTAKLPLVPVARLKRVIGRDTVECIEAGLYFGYLGMISEVLARTVGEMKQLGHDRPKLIATGGLAHLFKGDLPKKMEVVPDLTLEGLRIAHERMARGNKE